MSMTDPLADMFARIRNAGTAGHEKVEIPSSNLKIAVAKILKSEGYIKNFRVIDDRRQGVLRVYLKYDETNRHVIQGIRRVSRPGLRRYYRKERLPRILGGLGIAILTTSHGVMTDREARTEGIGGEVLCSVW
jgi:small subunit ribosomal protein S8